jgi:ankyrin repeat protein
MKLSKKNIDKKRNRVFKKTIKKKVIKNNNNKSRAKPKFKRRQLTKNKQNNKNKIYKFKGGNPEFNKLFIEVASDIQENNIENIKILLETNPGLINYQIGKNDSNLLQQAILLHKPDIVKLLVEKGADVNMISRDRMPLSYATFSDCFECVKILISNGANINGKDILGKTPLMYALARGPKVNEECIHYLLNNGANIEEKDEYGWTALFYSIEYGVPQKIVELLLKNGAILTQVSTIGQSPLQIACKRRNLEIIKLLFDYGAKITINSHDVAGNTALITATSNNKYDIVKFLLENGADPMIKDSIGKTALKYAKDSKTEELLKNKMKEFIAKNLKEKTQNKKEEEQLNQNMAENQEIINKLKEQNSDIIAKKLIEEEEQRIASENKKKAKEAAKKQALKDKKIQKQILNKKPNEDSIKKIVKEEEEEEEKEEIFPNKKQETNIENLEIQLANENRLQEEEDKLFQIEIDKAIEQSLKTYNSENEKRIILDFWTKYFDNKEENILQLKEIIPTLMKEQNASNLLISIIPAYTNKYYKTNPNINNILSLLFILIGIISFQLYKNGIYLLLKGGSAIQTVSSQIPNESYLSNDIDLVIISNNNLEENRLLSEKICKLLVWLTDENDGNKINSILSMVENKDPNHKIYKVILNNSNTSLMDIDYNILPSDIYNLYTNDIYIKNYNIKPYSNNNGIFSCPSILNLIYERIYYLIKYSSKEEIKSSKNRGFLTEKIPKSLNYLMNVYYIMVNNGERKGEDKTIFYNTIFDNFFQMYPILQNESSYNQEQLIQFLFNN